MALRFRVISGGVGGGVGVVGGGGGGGSDGYVVCMSESESKSES